MLAGERGQAASCREQRVPWHCCVSGVRTVRGWVTLYVRLPRGAPKRRKVDLVTALGAVVLDRVAAPAQCTAASHRLRSTGPIGCLWIQDAFTMDGTLVLDGVLHKSTPYNISSPLPHKWGADVDAVAREVRTAVEEWRAPSTPED